MVGAAGQRAAEPVQEVNGLYSANLLRQLMDISRALNLRLLELSGSEGHEGLKMSFATVMAHAGFDGARLSDIAAMNGMSKQAVSQTARELADLGYIELVPDSEDARARSIVLTPRGQALIDDSLRLIDTVRGEAAQIVGQKDFAIFENVAAKLWARMGRRAPWNET